LSEPRHFFCASRCRRNAERKNLSRVASVDSDFTVYRALGKRAFTNVFLGD
jgi:hypothetical protein